jgi:hypothetical protein
MFVGEMAWWQYRMIRQRNGASFLALLGIKASIVPKLFSQLTNRAVQGKEHCSRLRDCSVLLPQHPGNYQVST